MLFRLLFFLILIYLAIRFVLRIFSGPLRAFRAGMSTGPRGAPKPADPSKVIDEMRPCAACGTYAPSRHAYQKNGLYFCNRECHEIYLTRQKA